MGGVGLIGELDGNFPFVRYLQQVQNQITSNWSRMGGAQGRVSTAKTIAPLCDKTPDPLVARQADEGRA